MSLTRLRRTAIVSLLATAILALAACGGGAGEKAPAAKAPAGGAAADGAVKATLKEFSIVLAPATAKAGAVKLDATNGGTLPHEITVVKSDLAPDKLAQKDGVVNMSALKANGHIAPFDAGKTGSGTFTLEAGKYVVFCNIAGHYSGGMHAALTVN